MEWMFLESAWCARMPRKSMQTPNELLCSDDHGSEHPARDQCCESRRYDQCRSGILPQEAVNINLAATVALAGNITIDSLTGLGSSEVQLNSHTLTDGDSTSTAYPGTIAGIGGNLIKVGSGTLTLSGANTYTGVTTISAGAIRAESSGALGATETRAGTTVASGRLTATVLMRRLPRRNLEPQRRRPRGRHGCRRIGEREQHRERTRYSEQRHDYPRRSIQFPGLQRNGGWAL